MIKNTVCILSCAWRRSVTNNSKNNVVLNCLKEFLSITGSPDYVCIVRIVLAQDGAFVVDEKFGEQNFRVLSEMRGEISVYRPSKIEILG